MRCAGRDRDHWTQITKICPITWVLSSEQNTQSPMTWRAAAQIQYSTSTPQTSTLSNASHIHLFNLTKVHCSRDASVKPTEISTNAVSVRISNHLSKRYESLKSYLCTTVFNADGKSQSFRSSDVTNIIVSLKYKRNIPYVGQEHTSASSSRTVNSAQRVSEHAQRKAETHVLVASGRDTLS
ncbi:hypothetical protein EI94DRAFT_339200 [Lactarius quietus]|nr:hypothetical protein EI94DRAFT_339200 [Lactarius quietus]